MMYRHVPSRPVSDILSSQVGSKTGTSSDTVTAVQLTFKYNVSPLICMYMKLCTMTLCIRVMILH